MISNHPQFIDAIRDRKLLRIVYYSAPDAGTVDRECAPLDYGPGLDAADPLNRYWIWDPVASAGANPLGLHPDQIVKVQVLGKDFDPASFPLGGRSWHVQREWGTPSEPIDPASPPAAHGG